MSYGDKEVIAEKVQGQVKWFNCQKGYGFISRSDNNEDVFVHSRSIRAKAPGADMASLEDGESVEFDVVHGHFARECPSGAGGGGGYGGGGGGRRGGGGGSYGGGGGGRY